MALAIVLYYLPKILLVLACNLIGFIVVPVGLLFSSQVSRTVKTYAQYKKHGNYELVYLPDMMAIWNNLWDGARGDKRGWFHDKYAGRSEFFRRFWWLAVRNPTNTLGRVFFAFDIYPCDTRVLAGNPNVDEDTATWGYCWLIAKDLQTGKKYHSFKMMFPVAKTGYYLLWKAGYKFDLDDELSDFGKLPLVKDYFHVKALATQYARDGYRKGQAVKALDRLVPFSARGLIPTLKKIVS